MLRELLHSASRDISRVHLNRFQHIRAEVNRLSIARPNRRPDAQIEFRH